MLNNYLDRKFYNHNFQSKGESNNNNFKLEILFSALSSMFYQCFSKSLTHCEQDLNLCRTRVQTSYSNDRKFCSSDEHCTAVWQDVFMLNIWIIFHELQYRNKSELERKVFRITFEYLFVSFGEVRIIPDMEL